MAWLLPLIKTLELSIFCLLLEVYTDIYTLGK